MVGLVYLSRVCVLAVLLVALLLGGYTNFFDNVLNRWSSLRFRTRMLLTILLGWPLMGYVTPVLLDFWGFLTESVIGLGGEYMVSDLQTQLLLILIAVVAIQTTLLLVKLKNIEEQL